MSNLSFTSFSLVWLGFLSWDYCTCTLRYPADKRLKAGTYPIRLLCCTAPYEELWTNGRTETVYAFFTRPHKQDVQILWACRDVVLVENLVSWDFRRYLLEQMRITPVCCLTNLIPQVWQRLNPRCPFFFPAYVFYMMNIIHTVWPRFALGWTYLHWKCTFAKIGQFNWASWAINTLPNPAFSLSFLLQTASCIIANCLAC